MTTPLGSLNPVVPNLQSSQLFVTYWAMPVAAGAAVGQGLGTIVIPGAHLKSG